MKVENSTKLEYQRHSVNTANSQGRHSYQIQENKKTYSKIKSHFLTQDNVQYKVIISMPKIEYTV